MRRLSIELPEHQHKKIKALAAIHGLSLKDYVIEKTIPVSNANHEADLAETELMRLLAPRIEGARRGEVSKLSIRQMIAKAKVIGRK